MERNPLFSIWLASQRPTPLRDGPTHIQTPSCAQTIHMLKLARYSDTSRGESIDKRYDSILLDVRRDVALNI